MKACRVAVVVGGSGQIGKRIVKQFLENDCRVAVVSRGKTEMSFLVDLGRCEEELKIFHADVGSEKEVQDCFDKIRHTFGRIDFVIYAPGIEPDVDVPLVRYPIDAWEATFRVYVTGLFLCLRAALPRLESGGHFLVLSSAVTRFSGKDLPPLYAGHYAAAKAAVNEFCKWARREVHEKGCWLSRVAPAAVDVPFHRNSPQHRRPLFMVPVDVVVSKVVTAALSGVEIDEDLVKG